MKLKRAFRVLLFCCLCMPTLAASELKTDGGKISKVTVYRGQALVTRQLDVNLPHGDVELVAGHLPEHIISESLFAQTQTHVKILSVRYRQRAMQEDTRENVKVLDQKIRTLEQALHENTALIEHLASQWTMYDSLKISRQEKRHPAMGPDTVTTYDRRQGSANRLYLYHGI